VYERVLFFLDVEKSGVLGFDVVETSIFELSLENERIFLGDVAGYEYE